MEDITTVELVHRAILEYAAQEANRIWATTYDGTMSPELGFIGRFDPEKRKKRGRTHISGQVFRASPRDSVGGLCLSLDPYVTKWMDEDEISLLHEIGRECIQKGIIQYQKQFVGLILGDAREGRNYFNRFPTETGQTRLF